jgi:tetratricopeptide (TPR) repeat protein
MAKTRPRDKSRQQKGKGKDTKRNGVLSKAQVTPAQLLSEANALLQTSQPDEALVKAQRALSLLKPSSASTIQALPVLNLLGEICIELGELDAARGYFIEAAELDPDGEIPEDVGGGSEKFLWLAQLCEEGGAESIQWFEKGAAALRKVIGALQESTKKESQELAEEKKAKLANALCGCVEVYMTDLSWEEDAEAKCEAFITEALLIAPESPEVLQTLASIRISQVKFEEARSALKRSLALWKDLTPEDPRVPDFPTRISLSRLLLESQMYDEAMEVLENLITEDDSSVEAWYLGGWCLYLTAVNQKNEQEGQEGQSAMIGLQKLSRDWLQNSMKVYQSLDYEDDRLRQHAIELIEELDRVLGPSPEQDDEDDDEAEWEDASEEEQEADTVMTTT